MVELANCANCGAVFAKQMRDICRECYQLEEKAFETVYHFLMKRKNREAVLAEIVAETGVKESLIIKFIKANRLRVSQFPNLAYPCEKCQADITSGRICATCTNNLVQGLDEEERRSERQKNKEKKEREQVYYSFDRK